MLELMIQRSNVASFAERHILDGKQIDIAMMRAINKLMRWLQTHAVRAISKGTGVPAKVLRPRFRLRLSGKDELEASIWIGTYRIPLFKAASGRARQTKAGVTTRIKKVEGAFIATMQSGHTGIFKRLGKGRLPISEEMISIHEMAEDSLVVLIERKAKARFSELIAHELDYLYQKRKAA